MVKNPCAMRETWVRSLDREDPLEEGMATTRVFLPGESAGTEEPAIRATVHRVAKSWTRLKQLSTA